MPYVPTVATLDIAVGLVAGLDIGPGAIKLATAVAQGTGQWLTSVPVITKDTGTVGAGSGSIPLVVPPPALAAGLAAGYAANKILGIMAPLNILGLSIGLSQAMAKANVISIHPSVGVGACVISFGTSSAIPHMLKAFKDNQMTTEGSMMTARGIGMGLDITFAAFQIPCPITGAPGPSPSAGVGFGFIK